MKRYRMTAAELNARIKAKPVSREAPIQQEIVEWLRKAMPFAVVHHARGEINRSGKTWAKELAKAKRLGALKGFPDLIVLPYSNVGALFFEVKAEGGYATKDQKKMHEQMTELGYRVAVVRSVDDVRESLKEWGIGYTEEIPFRGIIT